MVVEGSEYQGRDEEVLGPSSPREVPKRESLFYLKAGEAEE